jgi:hypothetical protein
MTSDPNDQWLQRVRHTAADPSFWLLHAVVLRQAAEDLWNAGNEHDLRPGSELGSTVLVDWRVPDWTPPKTGGSTRDVCVMLFGFALENLAKGIIVCRDPARVSSNRLESWHGNGHDLARLFQWAKVEITEEERTLLDRTTRVTEWKGRYPVAMNFDKVSFHDPVMGHIGIGESWPEDDYKALSGLYDKAKAVLQQTMEEVPPLPADYSFG